MFEIAGTFNSVTCNQAQIVFYMYLCIIACSMNYNAFSAIFKKLNSNILKKEPSLWYIRVLYTVNYQNSYGYAEQDLILQMVLYAFGQNKQHKCWPSTSVLPIWN